MSSSTRMSHAEILRIRLEMKRSERRDLDDEIRAFNDSSRSEPLSLQRLKRHKLALKDEIARIEDELTPDIIA